MRIHTLIVRAAAWLLLTALQPAYAHGWIFPRENLWTAWYITPEVTFPTFLIIGLYIAGLRRRHRASRPISLGRRVSFFTGMMAVYLALQSPLDPLSDRLFLVHQIEHLMLYMVGPILIALSAPVAPLLRGFPPWARQGIVKPVIRNQVVRALYGFLIHPVVATLLFIGAMLFWQIPKYQDLALVNDTLHDVMHISMLIAGLFFWWLILDPRRYGARASNGLRLLLIWIVMMAAMVLGAYLTFKQRELYPAYDAWGRLWGISPLKDEEWGGLIIWIPGSLLCVIPALVVIKRQLQRDKEKHSAALAKKRAQSPMPTGVQSNRAAESETRAGGYAS